MAQIDRLDRSSSNRLDRLPLDRLDRSPYAGWPMVVFCAMIGVFTFHACTHMVAAGDTWVAMACGRHFVNHGVDTVEPFSFNSHKAGPTEEDIKQWPGWAQKLASPFSLETIQKWHPTGWINQNWLTHVIFYRLTTFFGSEEAPDYNALVYWKFALYLVNAIVVYYLARIMGAAVPTSAAAASFALFVGRTFLDIRPAGFANLMVPVFLLVLALAVYRNIHYIWLLVPVTVFWANCHGGYIYIFIMLAPFVVIHTLIDLPKRWTITISSILMWLVLFALAYKFLITDHYRMIYEHQMRKAYMPPGLLQEGSLYLLIVLAAVGITLTQLKNIKDGTIYGYNAAATGIVFLALLTKTIVKIPLSVPARFIKELQRSIGDAQSSFLLAFVVLTVGTLVVTFAKRRLLCLSLSKIPKVVMAAVAAFVATILFNPFHLTNLTHTFEISLSEHAASWRKVREWRPAFDWMDKTTTTANPVGDEEAFAVMLIIGVVAFAAYLAVRFVKARRCRTTGYVSRSGRAGHVGRSGQTEVHQWPRFDIVMFVIAVITVYMAVCSRRFIPIAASAACPVIALLIDRIISRVAAVINFRKTGQFAPAVLPDTAKKGIIAASLLITVVCGTAWGLKYKRIYLDPWPSDTMRDSVFMRMTASNLKPFEICRFINDNDISGRVYNYWTEGGALAFGQEPDAKTGKIPLQLFMDGRAQAAYNHDEFNLWNDIKGGGDKLKEILVKRRSLKNLKKEDFGQIGEWIDKQMVKHETWFVIMPSAEVPQPGTPIATISKHPKYLFVQALQTMPNWPIAYMDNYQYMFVNTTTSKGKELMLNVFKNKAKFPTEYSRDLTLANTYLMSAAGRPAAVRTNLAKKGLDHATKAFRADPCETSTRRLVLALRFPETRRQTYEVIKEYLDDFIQKQGEYAARGGYTNRLMAAIISAGYLMPYYKATDAGLYNSYNQFYKDHRDTPIQIAHKIKW